MSAYPNRDKVSSGLDLLREALAPYVCAQLEAHFKADWWTRGVYYVLPPIDRAKLPKQGGREDFAEGVDLAGMLTILDRNWGEVFGVRLDKQARNYVYLARDTRNSVAHHKGGDIETNDAIFALEGMTRLLEAVGSSRAKEIQAICKGVGAAPAPVPPPPAAVPVTNPAPVAEKAKPKAAQSALPLTARPWREVVLPHRDVQEGRLLEA